MNFRVDKIEDKLIIKLIGELDHHSAEEVRIRIDDKIERDNIKKVVMDFSNVTFMDSSGIGVVVGRLKKISSQGGKLCVTGLKKGVYKVFEISGLFKIIDCYKDVEEALKRI